MMDKQGLAFFSQQAFDNPHLLYREMRAQSPVCQIGDTRAFLVTTHEAVSEAVRRTEEFSSNLDGMLAWVDDGEPGIIDLAGSGSASNVIATADAPEHAVHRRLLLPPLKAKRIAALEAELREFARERVSSLIASGGGELCCTLAEPLPAYVVLRLLGLPLQSMEDVQKWAMMGGDFLAGRFRSADIETVFRETTALSQFLSTHLEQITQQPPSARGDSLADLLASGVEEGLLPREQAVGILVVLFGAAGESTASLLGSAVRMLAEAPELQARLRSNPGLIPDFIEEAVRLESPFKFHYRSVRAGTRLAGVALQKGDLLLIGWAAANRDPDVWDKPDDVVLGRDNATRNLGFGYGTHYCIGAPLARMEVRVALEELLAASSSFEVDPTKPYDYCQSIFVRRLTHLHLLARGV